MRDARPEVAYQIGVTKEFTEKARDNSAILTKLEGENKAVSPIVPVYDAKVVTTAERKQLKILSNTLNV